MELLKQDKYPEPEACASKDSARPILCHVMLRGGALYATDSYVAVRVPVAKSENDTEGTVPSEALKALRKQKYGSLRLADRADVLPMRESADAVVSFPRDDDEGNFPPIDNLIRKVGEDEMTIGVDVAKLVQVCKALGTTSVRLSIADPMKPIVVRPNMSSHISDGVDAAIGLVMPIRLPN